MMATLVPATALKSALSGGAGIFQAAIAYLGSPAVQASIINGLVDVDTVLADIGVAVPPVAVAANDLSVVIDVAKIGLPVVAALVAASATPSSPPAPGTIQVWGSDFEDPTYSGT